MAKRMFGSLVLILLVWMAIDAVLHYYALAPLYQAAGSLFRPLHQMNVTLVQCVRVLLACCFVAIYAALVRPRSLGNGFVFGALMGLALGISVGLGTYIHSPIPLALAWGWFAAAVIKSLVAGAILGWLIPR